MILRDDVEGAETMPPERLAAHVRAVPWGPDTRDLMLTIADLIDPA